MRFHTKMPMLSRRAFLGWLAATVPITAFARRAHAAAVVELAADARTLRAIADIVLPSELGPSGLNAEVARFQRWTAGYREGAELVHGYGTSILDFSGPTPETRWAAQLSMLDALARKQHGKRFADVAIEPRTVLLRAHLAEQKPARLQAVGRTPHVALALVAHFYASPAATDLCYGVQIGKQTCRPLASQGRKPLPLAVRPS